jgi:ribosomal protein S18 acetylase RimI-like enzyme
MCKDRAVVRIRPYSPNDSVSVTELSLRAWEPVFASLRVVLGSSMFDRLHPDWKIDQSNAVTAALADSNVQTWVADDDGRVVGFTSLRFDQERQLGEIVMLAVDPSAQRSGTGLSLTLDALDQMSAAGFATAMVETGGDAGHLPARSTYAKAGFSPLPVGRYFRAL